MDFDPKELSQPEVYKSLMAWVNERVIPRAKLKSPLLPRFLRVGLSELNGAEWRTLIWYAAAIFTLGAAFATLVRPLLKLLHVVP